MPKKQKENQSNNWKELVQGFVANMLEQAGENISQRIHKMIVRFKRRAIGSVLMAVGITFFLNGLAIYLNSITNNNFVGYGIVGLTTVLFGYIMLRE